MKKFFVIFLVLIMVFSFCTCGYASTLDKVVDVNAGNYQAGLNNNNSLMNENISKFDTTITEAMGAVSGIVKTVMDLITFIPQVILEWLLSVLMWVFPSMENIVFGEAIWGAAFRINFLIQQQAFL